MATGIVQYLDSGFRRNDGGGVNFVMPAYNLKVINTLKGIKAGIQEVIGSKRPGSIS